MGETVSFSVAGAVGAFVSGAVVVDVGSVVVGVIVFTAAGADVVCTAAGANVSRPAGAIVSTSAGADVNGGDVAVRVIVSRAVGATVACSVDVGAAEKNEGDGDAPDASKKGVCGARSKRRVEDRGRCSAPTWTSKRNDDSLRDHIMTSCPHRQEQDRDDRGRLGSTRPRALSSLIRTSVLVSFKTAWLERGARFSSLLLHLSWAVRNYPLILTDGATVCRELQRSCPRHADGVSALVFGGPHARNTAEAIIIHLAKDRALRVHLTEREIPKRLMRRSVSSFQPPGFSDPRRVTGMDV